MSTIRNFFAVAAAAMAIGTGFVHPIRTPRRTEKTYSPTLHPTKGWRGVKKKHRAKFKRRR